MIHRYSAYGLCFESELALPDLAPAAGSADPDVTIRIGDVGETLDGATEKYGVWQAAPGAFHLDIAEAGRYLIRAGREITIAPADGASDVDVRAFLRSSAMAALLQQRDILTIHASVAARDGRAVFFFGASGAGKSTTAAGMHQRGWQVLTDDILAIRFATSGPVALPGPASVWLWPDAGENLGIPDQDRGEARAGTGKFHLAVQQAIPSDMPLVAGFRLNPGAYPSVQVAPLPPRDAFEILWAYTFRRRYAIGMGMRQQVFSRVSALARDLPVTEICRPLDTFVLDDVLDAIEGTVARLDGQD